jgi:Ca2+-transporting ATPase
VICSDKTGTLTRNEMTVQELWVPSGTYRVDGIGYAPEGRLSINGNVLTSVPADVGALLRAGALCNDATLAQEDAMWRIHGDPTEGALVVAAHKAGMDVDALRREWERLDAIPFESERQYMATLHAAPDESRVAFIKGAPEVVIRRCATLVGGARLDPAEVTRHMEELASDGMRVLAVAAHALPAGHDRIEEDDVEQGLELLGLQGMIDPPRAEAIHAIETCHRAGITVKMITGDHQATAAAIGRQLGILADDGDAVSGRQIAAMDDAALRRAAMERNVFARVAPEDKLRLVRGLQAENQVAAMTGDGVNDAPALRQADIGVAMGITGTAVSKEAADIVLTDDNFSSIAAAVEEGRRVYDNLVKSLAFVLPTNLGEALILLIAVLLFPLVDGQPLLPMLPTQILWINLVATVALALPLAFEAMEPDVMSRPPRRPGAPIFGRFVAARTALVSLLMAAGAIGLFLYEFYAEVGRLEAVGSAHASAVALAYREAQTMAVTTVVLFQVFYLLNCRSLRDSIFRIGVFSNPMVYLGVVALLVLQAAFIYAPFMNTMFHSAPISPLDLGKSVLVALTVLPVISVEKAFRARRAAAAARSRQ